MGDGLNITTLQKMENDLDDLFLPYKIDLSLYRQINNTDLLDHIRRVGKYCMIKALSLLGETYNLASKGCTRNFSAVNFFIAKNGWRL